MDAPQLPGAESPTGADGGLPPGQASAFRRALDAQVEAGDPNLALVPSGPHDLTRPIDVSALRAALLASQPAQQTRESVPGFPEAAVPDGTAASTAIVDIAAALPRVAAATPSPGGPTVVVPRVSVPSLRAATTIATPSPKSVTAYAGGVGVGVGGGVGVGTDVTAVPPTLPEPGSEREPEREHGDEQEHEHSPRHSGGSGKPSRLPTAIGLSVVLGTVAATALVLIGVGHSGGPLAPSAMPTKSATPRAVAAAPPPHSAAPSHKPSPLASHSASHSPSPSPSATKASASPSAVPSFATIRWTSDYQPLVADIQSRLAKLRYLTASRDGAQYNVTQRTMTDTGNRWWQPADQVGYYQSATSSAIRAFKYDYLQHDQGQPPFDGSCDTATYQALVNATS